MNRTGDLLAIAAARRLPPPETCRRIRQSARISQAEMAKAIGVSRPTVTRWENGKRQPSPSHAESLGRVLDHLKNAHDPAGQPGRDEGAVGQRHAEE